MSEKVAVVGVRWASLSFLWCVLQVSYMAETFGDSFFMRTSNDEHVSILFIFSSFLLAQFFLPKHDSTSDAVIVL